MVRLTPAEMFKYDYRVPRFAELFKKNHEFEMVDGYSIKFAFDEITHKAILNSTQKSIRDIRLNTKKGEEYKISDIAKSAEFGGKGSGFGTRDEDIALKDLQNLIAGTTEETGGEIKIIAGGKIYPVFGAKTTPGTPKSDFELFDEAGKSWVFISHKKAGGAKAFQQYGGTSFKGSSLPAEMFKLNGVIGKWTHAIEKDLNATKVPSGYAVYRPVDDKKLLNKAIYGPDYPGPFGRENCNIIGQGKPVLKKEKPGIYELSFSDAIHNNGDVTWATRGGFKAVFSGTFRSGRTTISPTGTKIRNIRSMITPIELMRSRKNLRKI